MATSRIPGQNGPAPLSGEPEVAFVTSRDTGLTMVDEMTADEEKIAAGFAKLDSAATMFTDEKLTLDKSNSDINDVIRSVPSDEESSTHVGKGMTASEKVENMEEIALYALHVDDDPTLNPWTFRTWFLGRRLHYISHPLNAFVC